MFLSFSIDFHFIYNVHFILHYFFTTAHHFLWISFKHNKTPLISSTLFIRSLYLLGKLLMVPISFFTLSKVPLSFFDYQWYPRVIEHLTTVTFSNFFRLKSSKTVNFYFPSCFKLKNKGKKKKVNSFWRVWTEKIFDFSLKNTNFFFATILEGHKST